MTGIVVALQNEAKNVIEKTSAVEKTAKIGKKIYFGSVGNNNFVLIISGIGKVNAAFSTQYLIDNYPVDRIVNFGSV
ncbi:MAG: 5'-methylthioadenosine/adenosylhomocysteine nucleosidase, partial [Clostridia bacterium]|nr:5'-methylthioadenosine/adenosylhomocysteine nucleosidase [Clostridia bacterium]